MKTESLGASASPKPALVASDQVPSGLDPTGFDPARGYAAALPHLRAARFAYLAALYGVEKPCDEIYSHKWLDPVCVGGGCQSLSLKAAVDLLKRVTFMARTSGGTAGPDPALMAACDDAEAFLVKRRDSNSGPQGENSRSEVEGEAPQSGGTEGDASPTLKSHSGRGDKA